MTERIGFFITGKSALPASKEQEELPDEVYEKLAGGSAD